MEQPKRRRARAVPINETQKHYDLRIEDARTGMWVGSIEKLPHNVGGGFEAIARRPAPVYTSTFSSPSRIECLKFILTTTHTHL